MNGLYFLKNIKISFIGKNRSPCCRIRPCRDWIIIFIGGTLFSGAMIMLSAINFLLVEKFLSEPINASVAERKVELDTETLHAIVVEFEEKDKKFNNIKKNKPQISDPS